MQKFRADGFRKKDLRIGQATGQLLVVALFSFFSHQAMGFLETTSNLNGLKIASSATSWTATKSAGTLEAAQTVEIENRQGVRLDLQDTLFTDEKGQSVTLDRFFHQGRPVVLALIYYGCPGPCTVLLNNFVHELTYLQPQPGKDFDIVAISIDTREQSDLAQAKKTNYLKMYGRSADGNGWHFLTGSTASIQKVTDTVGFHFQRDPVTGIISHPSGLFFLTENGMLSKTLLGVNFSKREILSSLYEASHGQVEKFLNSVNRFVNNCGSYLPRTGVTLKLASFLAILTLVSGGFLFLYLRAMREHRRQ